MQYKEWLNEWLECYVKPTTKSKTYIRYSEIVRGYIIPKVGSYEICELTPLILQRFVTELLSSGNLKTGTGLSSNSVNGIITVLQNSLKSAFAVGLVSVYNADKIKRPKVKEKQVICFTKQEQRQIEQAILDGNKSKLYGVILTSFSVTIFAAEDNYTASWAEILNVPETSQHRNGWHLNGFNMVFCYFSLPCSAIWFFIPTLWQAGQKICVKQSNCFGHSVFRGSIFPDWVAQFSFGFCNLCAHRF